MLYDITWINTISACCFWVLLSVNMRCMGCCFGAMTGPGAEDSSGVLLHGAILLDGGAVHGTRAVQKRWVPAFIGKP